MAKTKRGNVDNAEPILSIADHGAGGNDSDSTGPVIDVTNAIDPAGDGGFDTGTGDTNTITGNSGRTYTGKKRGRKPGSSYKAETRKVAKVDVQGLASILYTIHLGISAITNAEEFVIEKTEAQTLAEATAEVAKYYDVSVNGKAMAWGNLAAVLGSTYAPRFIALKLRLQMESARDITNGAAT